MINLQNAACFSYFAPPNADTSGYVSIKRLPQIEELAGKKFSWHVYRADSQGARAIDTSFDELYAKTVYSKNINLGGKLYGVAGLEKYSALALAHLEENDICPAILYSRSSPAQGHAAAYRYKQKHPEIKWYAEFSDPLSRNVFGEHGSEESLAFEEVEQMVYRAADKIIFMNSNQQEYMLGYNRIGGNTEIRKKSLIMPHPMMAKKYVDVVKSDYILDADKINVGYFGAFYGKRRTHHEMLGLLANPNVCLHIFVTYFFDGAGSFEELENDVAGHYREANRVKINPGVTYFEMLNIASKMDYLYLEDLRFHEPINPYLPSKYADYCTAAQSGSTKIIALVQPNSTLSKVESSILLKTDNITELFAKSLSD